MSEMKEPGAGPRNASLGDEIVGRIDELAAISETPEHLTFASSLPKSIARRPTLS